MIRIAHIFLLTELIPEEYPAFLTWLRNREYPFKGSLGRTGVQKPFVREVKMFDVNVRQEVMNDFLGEMKCISYRGILDNNDKKFDMKDAHFSSRKLEMMKAIVSTVTPLKGINMNKIEAKPIGKFPPEGVSFAYAIPMGYLKDPRQKGTEIEVM